jgi:hypothetical protein
MRIAEAIIKKSRTVILILIGLGILYLGLKLLAWWITPYVCRIDYKERIEHLGGFIEFRKQCEQIFPLVKNSPEMIDNPTGLPKIISQLNPTGLCIHSKDPYVLTIVLSGGFMHSAILVVMDTTTNYKPQIGNNWVRKELSRGVFYFRE